MESLLIDVLKIAAPYSGWIVWNLFLAAIPLALSFWLFRWYRGGSSLLWWLGLLVFIAFLPNAPYLLTDIIHLIEAIRAGYSAWVITLVFFPLHMLAIVGGFEAYVISLLNQGSFLHKQGAKRWIVGSELIVHALSAIGIYLGRFLRFNSWDLVTKPDILLIQTLDQLTQKRPLLIIAIAFVILTVLYWLMKQINLGLLLRWRDLRRQHREDVRARKNLLR